ncbi:MAG: HAMP domain-containing sensor histidine kinase [Leptolyngbyaceae bacterium]|nr:HAMP domain-containing sensor histidine kinase [Leptolyngbyaceae bacterium]
MFQATRRRLAIWYTTVTAVLLLMFASGFYWYVRNTLVERVDDTLNHVVEVVERSLIIEPDGKGNRESDQLLPSFQVNVEASFRSNGETVDDDHIDLEWFNAEGALLWSTLERPLKVPLHVNPYGETVHQGDTLLLRQVTRKIQRGRQVLGYLRVSHPWFEVTKPTQRLMVDLIFGSLFTIGAVAAIGWLLSGLAIAPVIESYQRMKQFTADASHELRNPIAVLQTNVQVALADPNPDPIAQQTQFQIIERITRRLGRLVEDLLFLARQDSGIAQWPTQPISLFGVVQEVVEEQTAIAHLRHINLTLKPLPSSEFVAASTLALVEGDRTQLLQLFTNLISNAIQYTPAHGHITVTLECKSSQPKRNDKPDWVEVQVADTGIGIAATDLSQVFNRFYQVDAARSRRPNPVGHTSSGSGLGLAIAQVIVENHGGSIAIASELAKGTTVTVALPLKPVLYPNPV